MGAYGDGATVHLGMWDMVVALSSCVSVSLHPRGLLHTHPLRPYSPPSKCDTDVYSHTSSSAYTTHRCPQVGLLVVWPFEQGSLMQIAVANLVSITFFGFQAQVTPFISRTDNFLALACSLSLAVMFLCTIFYKNATLTELPAIRHRMSLEQRATYEIDGLGLSVIFMVCLFGALAFSAVVTVYQAFLQHKEHQDTLARRLRLRDDGTAVLPTALEEGCQYHLFLSHTWVQGQDQMRVVKRRLLEILPGTFHSPLRIFLDVDDLKTGAGAELIDVSNVVLVFATEKYFASRACARELLRVRRLRRWRLKPTLVLLLRSFTYPNPGCPTPEATRPRARAR